MQWCQSDEEDANVPQVEPEKDLKFGDEEDVNVPQVEPEKDLKSGDAEDANVPQVETEKETSVPLVVKNAGSSLKGMQLQCLWIASPWSRSSN